MAHQTNGLLSGSDEVLHQACNLPATTIPPCVAQAQVRVRAQTDNVAGVRIPKFEEVVTAGESKMALTGLGKGGQQVQQCRKVGASRGVWTFVLSTQRMLCLHACRTG